MVRSVLPLTLLPALAFGAAIRHFDVVASLVPARKAGAPTAVAVSFQALDPDLRLNENPAPRLTLDALQAVLVDKQVRPAAGAPDYDPLKAKYLDLARPVLFPVAISPVAPKGEQQVKASVVFFYCSQREAWCRRGTADVLIPVSVR